MEQLARHSDAGRLHSQEAVFLSPTARVASQTSSRTQDPHALLTLPEFIREGVPEEIQRQMEVRREAETLLTLPEFIKRYPRPELVQPSALHRGMAGRSFRGLYTENTSPQGPGNERSASGDTPPRRTK